MTRPPRTEPDPGFCDGIGLDNPGWPGPWGCGTVWWEVADGAITTHLCALSDDHVDYRDEPHVCTLGHRQDVEKPRRRWRDRLLRRPVEELPLRRDPWFNMTVPQCPQTAARPAPGPGRPSAPSKRS
jgi:hypothetical protein